MYQSNATYRASYRVYVGNDADSLYSDENLIYTWDGGANKGRVQEHYFNANRKSGKFIGIYFDDTTNSTSATGMRIAEIFVDGKELDTETYNSTSATVGARISADNNLLKGKEATVKLAKRTTDQKYRYASGSSFERLTDGTLSTKHGDIYGSGNDYVLLVYSLGGTATIEGFEFFNRSAAQNSSYEVYVGNSTNDILNENNLIYTYDGSTDIAESYRCQYVYFAAPKKGSYIAIKLIKTYGESASSNNFRVSEIAAYGEVTEPKTYELYSTRNVTSFADTNLLHGLTAERTGSTTGTAGWNAALTDGVVNSKKDLTGITAGTTYLTYDMGSTAVIDKFVIGQYANYATGIEYYVSRDKGTLYDSANLVATYDINDLFSTNSESYDASVVFNADSKPVGRYVGLRIVFLSGNQTTLRVYEISAIGEKCSHTAGEPVVENNVDATCTTEGSYDSVVYCSVCNIEMSRTTETTEALGHTPKTVDGKAPTCTEPGLTEGSECSVCGETIKAQDPIKELGHTEETVKGYAATCSTKGLTDGIKCSVCGETIKAQEEIKALGHTEIDLPEVPATCTTAGKTAGKQCSVCKTITVAQKATAALGHKEVALAAVAATYEKAGLTAGKQCSVCKKITLAQKVVPALTKTSLKKAKFTLKAKTYTGKALTQSFTVKLGSKTLKNKVDYTISYKNNKNIGKATVTIKGIGAYKDSVSKTFAINPKKLSGLKVKAGKKQLTVSFKKDSKVGGYEILYATSKNFKKDKKTIKIKSYKTAKKVISKLKSKKTYYVKVRAFKKVSGKTYYGAYTSVKKIKIK